MKKRKKQKNGGRNGNIPRRCCRQYCIGCPWTIMQLTGKKTKRR
ncbi:MAG TPA: hypothetical protein VFN74_03610 [Chloroflexota bacterium]|nr:hypothetical protein [Chloroflexota bacterium]